MATYCGNNRRHPDLVNKTRRKGTRYECLRKGIGVGLHSPVDPSYAGPYKPIDKTRIYCGNQKKHSDAYARFGSITDCMRKGVGIGKMLRARGR